MARRQVYLFDIIILGYLALLSLLILVFGRPMGLYYDELLMNLARREMQDDSINKGQKEVMNYVS